MASSTKERPKKGDAALRSSTSRSKASTSRSKSETPNGKGAKTEPATEIREPISSRINLTAVSIVGIAAVVAIVIALVAIGNSDNSGSTAVASQGDVLQPDSPALADSTSSPANRHAAVAYLKGQGFGRQDYCFAICVPHTIDRGAGAVAAQPILTTNELVAWLNGNSPQAVATRNRAEQLLSPAEYQRYLSGQYFVRVQFKHPMSYTGNSELAGGQVVLTSGSRGVGAGDILFVFVGDLKHGHGKPMADENGNQRADCGNMHAVPQGSSPGVPQKPGQTPPRAKTPPRGNVKTPGTKPSTPTSPPSEIPKRDTPSNTPGPTGNGKPQPVGDTQPAGGSGPDNSNTGPFNPNPNPAPPPGDSPPAGNGGSTPVPGTDPGGY